MTLITNMVINVKNKCQTYRIAVAKIPTADYRIADLTYLRDEAVSRSGICPTTAHLFYGSVDVMLIVSEIQHIMPRRQFVVSAIFVAATFISQSTAKAKAKPLKILFVCQFGTAKSAIAREMFKKSARERGIVVEVISRGITLEDHISPDLRQKLLVDGIDVNAVQPKAMAGEDWAAADVLVRFNPLPDSVKNRDVRDWSDLPSVNDDYANARRILASRIDALLTEITDKQR